MNKKKIIQISISTILCIVVLTSFLFAATFPGYTPPDVDSAGYTSETPFISSSIGQCTWFVWGRAYEKLGISLSRNYYGDAKTWWPNKDRDGGSVPKTDSIAVFHNEPYGHVVYVEYVDGDDIYFNEANWNGVGYKGELKVLSVSDFEKRSGSGNFSGYIYLKSDDKDNTNDSKTETQVIPVEDEEFENSGNTQAKDTQLSEDIQNFDENNTNESNDYGDYDQTDIYKMKKYNTKRSDYPELDTSAEDEVLSESGSKYSPEIAYYRFRDFFY